MRKQEDDNGKDQLEGRTSGWERHLFIYLFIFYFLHHKQEIEL